MKAIYQFHPEFVGSQVWWGDPEQSWGMATIEGGDVLVPGNGVVIIGMSERTSRQAITQVAAKLFTEGAATQVIVGGMPKLRAAMHLDTVFTFADRDVVTIYPDIVDAMQTFTLHPTDNESVWRWWRRPSRSSKWWPPRSALASCAWWRRAAHLRLGAAAVGQRQQSRRRRTRRGVRVRPQHPHQHPPAAGRHRGDHHRRRRTRTWPRRRPLHDLPAIRDGLD